MDQQKYFYLHAVNGDNDREECHQTREQTQDSQGIERIVVEAIWQIHNACQLPKRNEHEARVESLWGNFNLGLLAIDMIAHYECPVE